MEQEAFFTGYCRQTDDSRMVSVVMQEQTLMEIDCYYPDCPYARDCTIAQNVDAFLK